MIKISIYKNKEIKNNTLKNNKSQEVNFNNLKKIEMHIVNRMST